MMKYRVLIRRTTQEFGSVTVEAETQVEAEISALREAMRGAVSYIPAPASLRIVSATSIQQETPPWTQRFTSRIRGA